MIAKGFILISSTDTTEWMALAAGDTGKDGAVRDTHPRKSLTTTAQTKTIEVTTPIAAFIRMVALT